ncbi:MAG TPA: hypothetical protein VII06_22890 [Chloroflexota bacterium]|jgi:hypothetical protein
MTMWDVMAGAGDAGVDALVTKLGAFRATLGADERDLFDALLLAAASGATDDVQAFAFSTLAARQLALAAVVALGIGAGTLSPFAGGTALAAPADPQSLAAPTDQQSLYTPAGGTLGFTLRDTVIREQLRRDGTGADRGVVWSAEFTSQWALTPDQLDRWSAQAIGLIADQLGGDVRLAGYERLDARDVGEQQVAYRYQLAAPSGQAVGEATIVVFARGDRVGMAATGAIGTSAPQDAATLARALDASPSRG